MGTAVSVSKSAVSRECDSKATCSSRVQPPRAAWQIRNVRLLLLPFVREHTHVHKTHRLYGGKIANVHVIVCMCVRERARAVCVCACLCM